MSEPASLLGHALRPEERLLWSGSPRARLAPGDAEAAFVAAVVAFAVLAGVTALGLDARAGIAPLGLPVAALGACVLGLSLTVTRVAAAGPILTIALASAAPLLAVALARGGLERWTALLCPAGSIAFVLVWVALRWVEHRATRYHLSADRAFIEEPGRYVISFEIEGAPLARPSRLARGRLGTIELVAKRGQLRTNQGVVLPVPASRRRFVRVDYPGDAVRAWREAADGKAT